MVVFIKHNSPEIREKLREVGFSICVCAEFSDSIWLDYHPNSDDFQYDIHGVGYGNLYTNKKTPLERIEDWLKIEGFFSENREFYETVEEFLKNYKPKKVVSDQPSN